MIIAGRSSGGIAFWNIQTGKRISRQPLHRAAISGITIDPDGKHVAIAASDGAVLYCALGAKTAKLLGTLLHLPDGWVAFTPDGSYKYGGIVNGSFWHVLQLCRFEVGELTAVAPHLRVPEYAPLFERDETEEDEG